MTKALNFFRIVLLAVILLSSVAEAGKRRRKRPQPSCKFQGPFPYTASLRTEAGFRCGATLITKDAVLTAASCAQDQITEVFLGGFEREVPIKRRNVSSVVIHPDFNGNPVDGNDLAIIKLSSKTCLKPVPNLGSNVFAGQQYFVLGFGQTGPYEPIAGSLLGANVTNYEIITCNSSFGVMPPLTELQLCTQNLACNCGAICSGDEGGPVILRETTLDFVDTLVGVMSYSTGNGTCSEAESYGVHTNVQPYLNWIQRTLVAFDL